MAIEKFSSLIMTSSGQWMQQLSNQLPGEIINESYAAKKLDDQPEQFRVLTRTRSGQEDLCLVITKPTKDWLKACAILSAKDNWDLEDDNEERNISVFGIKKILVPDGLNSGSVEMTTSLDSLLVIAPNGKYALRSKYYKGSTKTDKSIIWESHDIISDSWKYTLGKVLEAKWDPSKRKRGFFSELAFDRNESTSLAVVRDSDSAIPRLIVRLEVKSTPQRKEKVWVEDISNIFCREEEVIFESNNSITGRGSELIVRKDGEYLFTSDTSFLPQTQRYKR